MDISTASTTVLGAALSAFNLRYNGRTVECLYQGSKVYADGTCMQYLYDADSLTAKKTMQGYHGSIVGFRLFDKEYPVEPRTLFYDFLYLHGMVSSYGKDFHLDADCWTDVRAKIDIDACQARAVCEYALLQQQGTFGVLDSITTFKEWHEQHVEVQYSGYTDSYMRYADSNTIYCYPEYESRLRKSFMYTGNVLTKHDNVTYEISKRQPIVFDNDWCVVYSDMFLDDLCAIQFLSHFYKKLYLITVREADMTGNPYCAKSVQNLDDLLVVTGKWFEQVLISRSIVSRFGDDVSECDCYVMANATKVASDLNAGIKFKSISAMIGSDTPETEWNSGQDMQSYNELLSYGINQYIKEFCESKAEPPVVDLDFYDEYVASMEAIKEETYCYDLQMVMNALVKIWRDPLPR